MDDKHLTAPTRVDRIFNSLFGWIISAGLAPANFYMLEVRGRRSGRVYSTPVDLLRHDGRDYLVAPRGNTQWVRNARASGAVTLRQGKAREDYALTELADASKPEILKDYLDTYRAQVQRFFPVPAGSEARAFVPLAGRYPCFELQRR